MHVPVCPSFTGVESPASHGTRALAVWSQPGASAGRDKSQGQLLSVGSGCIPRPKCHARDRGGSFAKDSGSSCLSPSLEVLAYRSAPEDGRAARCECCTFAGLSVSCVLVVALLLIVVLLFH